MKQEKGEKKMADFRPSVPQCPQCGKFHPPLKEGEECPLKNTINNNQSGSNKSVDVSDILLNMRNILISNIQSKEIKDLEKFKQYIIIKLNKEIENYSE